MCFFSFSGSSKGEWLRCSEHYRQQHCPELDTCGWCLWIPSVLEAHLRSAVNDMFSLTILTLNLAACYLLTGTATVLFKSGVGVKIIYLDLFE